MRFYVYTLSHFRKYHSYAKVKLLWDKAPRTCASIVDTLPSTMLASHGRHSGGEALCITNRVISLGQENATTDFEVSST